MKKFVYHGAVSSGATLVDGDNVLEVVFFFGTEYSLPEENDHVKTLVELGLLLPVDEAAASTPTVKSNGSSGKGSK